jgi:adenylate cyclase
VHDPTVWRAAGLYDPAAPGADERRALLEYLTSRGATLEQLVGAHALGVLPGVAGDLVSRRGTARVSVDQIAARSGVSVARVTRALLAAGLPVGPDTEVPEDLLDLMAAFEAGAQLMGDDAILAFTRVLGASAINIAEAAVALFWAEFGPGSVSEGPDELVRARISEAATAAFLAVPDVLAKIVLEQFERAQQRAQTVRGWAGPVTSDGVQPVAGTDGPTETVALGFVDLVGSTAWAHQLNLREQNLALTRFESAAWSSAVLAGGRVVKMIGDEVFFAAPTADAACRIGTEVCRAAVEDPLLPPARGVVGTGLATPREGDYFGPLVNLLSRLVKTGGPSELVVTEPAAKDLDPHRWSLHELTPVDLRGVPEPVRVFTVVPQPQPAPPAQPA